MAGRLHRDGLAALLFDLLTESEDRVRRTRFDIRLLTDRLAGVTRWIGDQRETNDLPVGYFGAGTGAAAALRAAAADDLDIDAVGARGGRVDLAADRVSDVDAPCRFVVGGEDTAGLERNETVLAELTRENRLEVVAGAGHRFEGPAN